MFTPPSVFTARVGGDGSTLALRPGMPCSWLVPPAAFAQLAWLAGASRKNAEGSKAAGWHGGTSTVVRWRRASQLQPTADWRAQSLAACVPLQAATWSDIVWKKEKKQWNKWLILAQLINCDSYIQLVLILKLILVFSSYRSWIQLYIFRPLGLASCQEN